MDTVSAEETELKAKAFMRKISEGTPLVPKSTLRLKRNSNIAIYHLHTSFGVRATVFPTSQGEVKIRPTCGACGDSLKHIDGQGWLCTWCTRPMPAGWGLHFGGLHGCGWDGDIFSFHPEARRNLELEAQQIFDPLASVLAIGALEIGLERWLRQGDLESPPQAIFSLDLPSIKV